MKHLTMANRSEVLLLGKQLLSHSVMYVCNVISWTLIASLQLTSKDTDRLLDKLFISKQITLKM